MDLLVTDGHDGLLAAVGELFSATPRQRCLVHKQRNVMSAIPRREREEVQAELSGILETREEGGCANQPAMRLKPNMLSATPKPCAVWWRMKSIC